MLRSPSCPVHSDYRIWCINALTSVFSSRPSSGQGLLCSSFLVCSCCVNSFVPPGFRSKTADYITACVSLRFLLQLTNHLASLQPFMAQNNKQPAALQTCVQFPPCTAITAGG